MAHNKITVFAHRETDAVTLLRRAYPQLQDITTLFTVCEESDFENLLTNITAFITVEGELIDIDKLCWLGIGKTSENCIDSLRAMFLAYQRKTTGQSLIAFVLTFHV